LNEQLHHAERLRKLRKLREDLLHRISGGPTKQVLLSNIELFDLHDRVNGR
jgi:hypothetical protein